MKHEFSFDIKNINHDIIVKFNIIFNTKAKLFKKLFMFLAIFKIFGQILKEYILIL